MTIPIAPTPALSGWLTEYRAEMRRRSWSKATQKRYGRELERFIEHVGDKPVAEVTLQDCRSYMDLFLPPRAPSTFNLELGMLNGFFSWLVDEEALKVSPAAKIKRARTVPLRNRVRTRITSAQVRQMLAEARTSTEVIGLTLLANTGGRRNALSELRWRSVDLKERNTITFERAKGGKRQVVPIAPALRKVLVARLLDAGATIGPDTFVIPSRRETGLLERDDRFLWHAVRSVAKRCGIKAHVHAFRSAFAVEFLRSNPGCIEHARALLGHGSIATTQGYLNDMDEEELKERVATFSFDAPSLPRDLANTMSLTSREEALTHGA